MRSAKWQQWLIGCGLVFAGLASAGQGLAADADANLKAALKSLGKQKKAKVLAVVEKNKDALVMVQFILNIKIVRNGQEQNQEQKIRAAGVTLNANGLTLASNASTDPTAGRRLPAGMTAEASLLNVKIIMNDGSEVPAKVAMRDKDLDIILVQPEKVEKPFTFVTLKPAVKPGLLDALIAFSRLGFDTNRTPVLLPGTVRGIIEKPRKFYYAGIGGTGIPVFDSNGDCFGISLRRIGEKGPVGPPLVLPAEDIDEVIKQVKPTAAAMPAATTPAEGK